jgi:hypothetical protein
MENLEDYYLQKMIDCQFGDQEVDHMKADNILCELLIKLGYEKVVEEYRSIPKWFA